MIRKRLKINEISPKVGIARLYLMEDICIIILNKGL